MDRFADLVNFISRVTGESSPEPVIVSGDASFRKYYRYGDRIYVDAPPATEKNREFVELSSVYNRYGIPVPKVYEADLQNGYLCVEDLGDVMFSSRLNDSNSMHEMYLKATDLLLKIASVSEKFTPFDEEFIRREDQIFIDWYLDAHLGRKLIGSDEKVWNQTVGQLVDNCLAQPQVAMHRDFHCRNIMIRQDGSLALVDFQDTVTGPVTYDLVSLIKDCYITLDPELRNEVIRYAFDGYSSMGILKNKSLEEFEFFLDLTGMQRHLKAIGIFCRLLHRDGKDGYLQYLPRTFDYVREVSSKYSVLGDFKILLEDRLL